MRSNVLNQTPRISTPEVAPIDKHTGEPAERVGFTEFGHTIYEATFFDKEATVKNKVQAKNPDGSLMWREYTDGSGGKYPVWVTKPVYTKKRFILEADGQGNLRKVFHFEATPEEKAADLMKRRRNEIVDDFFDRAAEFGVSGSELAERMAANLGLERAPEPEEPVHDYEPADDVMGFTELPQGDAQEDEAIEYPYHRGGGVYEFSDGSTERMKKDDAVERQAAIYAGDG